MKKRIMTMILLGIKQFRDPYYQGFAAQLSFYFTLSLVPIAMLITQLFGAIFGDTIEQAIGWLTDVASEGISHQIVQLVSYKSAAALNVVFVFVVLWAGSRAQFSLMRITNYTFTEGQSTGRGYLRERIRAVANVTIFLLTILISLVVLVYGEQLLKLFLSIFRLGDESANLWLILRWPIVFALYFLMLSYNYYVMPSKKLPYRKIIPGTIFASIGMLVVSLGYSFYASQVAEYDILYGSLASVVALLFWFYFMAWVLCLGVLFNKVWDETKTE